MEYLYLPESVDRYLVDAPALRQALAALRREDRPSTAFPYALKSKRLVYRLLAQHEISQEIAALLHMLDETLARGWRQSALLRTRSSKEFQSHLATLLLAHRLQECRISVSNPDEEASFGDGSRPDVVTGGAEESDQTTAFEVYRPRDWEGTAQTMDGLHTALRNLDVPFDFVVDSRFVSPHDGSVPVVHASVIDRALGDASRREGLVETVIDWCAASLMRGQASERNRSFEIIGGHSLAMQILACRPAGGKMPEREIGSWLPSLSGIAPEGVFRRVLRTTKGKLDRQQGAAFGTEAVMVVDVTRLTSVRSELLHPVYLREFCVDAGRELRDALARWRAIAFWWPTYARDAGKDRLPILVARDPMDVGGYLSAVVARRGVTKVDDCVWADADVLVSDRGG